MAEQDHDLNQSLEALWQCLSQDKRPLGMLLGAGCPLSIRVKLDDGETRPLIPDIAGLTENISKVMVAGDFADQFTALVNGLTEDQDGRSPNVEEMLTRLRTLATVVGAHTVRDLDGESIADLERALTDAITREVTVDIPEEITPYDHLAVWIRSASRSTPVNVFTTNYDTVLESALERNDTPFFDGFVGVNEPFLDTTAMELDDLPARWARVWKLHGSANWALQESGRVVRRDPTGPEEQRLVHPSHLKYDESRRMPYVLMQDQLRDFLREPSATLTISGYSFGDDHINELLDHGLKSNPTATAFALQYSKLDDYPRACALADTNPSLSVVARDGGVFARRRAAWLSGDDDAPTNCPLGDFAAFGQRLQRLAGRGPATGSPGDGAVDQ